MSGQGFPNEGKDSRLFGFLGPLISRVSFRDPHPPVVHKHAQWGWYLKTYSGKWRPYLVFNFRIGGKWRMGRIGWRYDSYWPNAAGVIEPGYILGAAGPFKHVDSPLLYY